MARDSRITKVRSSSELDIKQNNHDQALDNSDTESLIHLTLETISGVEDVDENENTKFDCPPQNTDLKGYFDRRMLEGASFLSKNRVFIKVKPDILTQCKARIEAIDITTWKQANQKSL